jgi:hypothetical protein
LPSKFAQALLDLTPEVGAWSARNFPPSLPDHPILGIYEELGEWNHARLKAHQKIRGTPEEHRAAEIDALCDATIFACDFMFRVHPSAFEMVANAFDKTRRVADSEDSMHPNWWSHRIMATAGTMALSMAEAYEDQGFDINVSLAGMLSWLTGLLVLLDAYADQVLGVVLADEVARTWATVKNRDWSASPTDAHLVAEAEASVDRA